MSLESAVSGIAYQPSLMQLAGCVLVIAGSIAAWVLVRSVVVGKVLQRIEQYNDNLHQWAVQTDIVDRLALFVPLIIVSLFSHVFPVYSGVSRPLIASVRNLLIVFVFVTPAFSLKELLKAFDLPPQLKQPERIQQVIIGGHVAGWLITVIFAIVCYSSIVGIFSDPPGIIKLIGAACAAAFLATAFWVKNRTEEADETHPAARPGQASQPQRPSPETGVPDQFYLVDAVLAEDTKLLDRMISQGGDINEIDKNGNTPLIAAIQHDLPDMIRALLERGCRTDGHDRDGWTPLTMAAFTGRTKAVSNLLDSGADLNAPSGHGWSPLMWALHSGHTEIADLLVQRGASTDKRQNYIWTRFPDRIAILNFLLKLYRLQIGAPPDTPQRFLPHTFAPGISDMPYRLEINVDDKWLSRIVSLSMLGEGSGSKSRCYKVIFDTVWVVKIPPSPITGFDAYIKAINAERKTVEQLAAHFVCIAPGLSDILRKIPGFAPPKEMDKVAAEKMAATWLTENPTWQEYLKIDKGFAFFMDMSQHTFLSQHIEKLHGRDLAAGVKDELARQVQLISDLIGLETVYGEKNSSLYNPVYESYIQFEDDVTRLLKMHKGGRNISTYEMKTWFVAHIFRQSQDIEKEGLSAGLAKKISGLLEALSSRDNEALTAYCEMVMARVTAKSFRYNTSQMAGVIDNLLLLLVRLQESGISLRDLKPENLFIVNEESGESSIGIIDFETAVHIENNGEISGRVFLGGTPKFATPTHLLTNQNLSEVFDDIVSVYYYQDWYAVVGMIYGTVTGKILFEQTAGELMRIMKKIRAQRKNQPALIRCFKSESTSFWQHVWREFTRKTTAAADRLQSVTLDLPDDIQDLLLANCQAQQQADRQAVKDFIKQTTPFGDQRINQKFIEASAGALEKTRAKWEANTAAQGRKRMLAFLGNLIYLKKQTDKTAEHIKVLETVGMTIDVRTLMEIMLTCVYKGMYRIQWRITPDKQAKEAAGGETPPSTEKETTTPTDKMIIGTTISFD